MDEQTTVVRLEDVQAARRRVGEVLPVTPCPESMALSRLCGSVVYCKLEYLQPTGSFKERGAVNALSQLSADARRRGVVAASAGNHALALAYHGRRLGIPVTVVMPNAAPLVKSRTCQELEAMVVRHGESFAEARQKADELVASQGLTYIHGFDDPAVIAGQGTLGLEVLEQVPELDAMVVPVGGGGLIAGVAVAIKSLRPGVAVWAVEAERYSSLTAAMRAGQPVTVPPCSTLADGLAVGRVGSNAFATLAPLIDGVVTVSESELAIAILRLLELEKAVVEGAGAAPLAALMSGKLPQLKGKRVVLPLCGGNIDPLVLHRVIEVGMVADGRLCRFDAVISDRPGGLAQLARVVADAGASVQSLRHERMFAGPDIAQVHVELVVETHGLDHARRLRDQLAAVGFISAPPQKPADPLH